MSEYNRAAVLLGAISDVGANPTAVRDDVRPLGSLTPPTVSVVVPCFNEATVLSEFDRRAVAECRRVCGEAYELVFVDDGSRDETWSVIESLAAVDHNVVGVRLMRNHGHQAAASAGLAFSQGRRVLLIDADLQDPPELLGQMMQAMDREQADVVFGQRVARAGETKFKKVSAAAFYRVLSRLTAVPIPVDAGDFRLMTRRVVDTLVAMPEQHRFLRGMVAWIGGHQVAFKYERNSRFAGASHYPLVKMVRFALDAVTGFSTIPLRLASWCGFGAAIIAFGFLGVTIWSWAMHSTVLGWSSIMTAIMFLGAVQLMVLGIMGEYIGRLFQEAKGRPLFLVDHVLARGQTINLPLAIANEQTKMRPEPSEIVYGATKPASQYARQDAALIGAWSHDRS